MKILVKSSLFIAVLFAICVPALANNAWVETLEIATVRQGEGVEHAFIRQLESDPGLFGFSGSLTDLKEIKKWTGIQAHRLAIKFGYVDPKFGGEIWVAEANKVAFVIGKNDSGLQCREFVRGGSEEPFPGSPERSIQTAGNNIYNFLAHEDDDGNFITGVNYEYFQPPVVALKDI